MPRRTDPFAIDEITRNLERRLRVLERYSAFLRPPGRIPTVVRTGNHVNLNGLLNDEHPQYVLTNNIGDPSPSRFGDVGSRGTTRTYAARDHVHDRTDDDKILQTLPNEIEVPQPSRLGDVGKSGTKNRKYAAADHVHDRTEDYGRIMMLRVM